MLLVCCYWIDDWGGCIRDGKRSDVLEGYEWGSTKSTSILVIEVDWIENGLELEQRGCKFEGHGGDDGILHRGLENVWLKVDILAFDLIELNSKHGTEEEFEWGKELAELLWSRVDRFGSMTFKELAEGPELSKFGRICAAWFDETIEGRVNGNETSEFEGWGLLLLHDGAVEKELLEVEGQDGATERFGLVWFDEAVEYGSELPENEGQVRWIEWLEVEGFCSVWFIESVSSSSFSIVSSSSTTRGAMLNKSLRSPMVIVVSSVFRLSRGTSTVFNRRFMRSSIVPRTTNRWMNVGLQKANYKSWNVGRWIQVNECENLNSMMGECSLQSLRALLVFAVCICKEVRAQLMASNFCKSEILLSLVMTLVLDITWFKSSGCGDHR